jgi:hypothetical protein
MDGWMDGWLEWMDGWMDGWMDEWKYLFTLILKIVDIYKLI